MWEPVQTGSLELSSGREPHFHCSMGCQIMIIFATSCPRGLHSTLCELFRSSLGRFCIDLGLIVDTLLHAENLKFYWFLNSFVAFRLFRKGMTNHRFWHPFWHHFRIILVSFFDTFSASIFGCLFGCHFSIFARKWDPKRLP